jgi:hypothetical protein
LSVHREIFAIVLPKVRVQLDEPKLQTLASVMHIPSLVKHGITLGSKSIEKIGSEHLRVPLGATDIIWSTVNMD